MVKPPGSKTAVPSAEEIAQRRGVIRARLEADRRARLDRLAAMTQPNGPVVVQESDEGREPWRREMMPVVLLPRSLRADQGNPSITEWCPTCEERVVPLRGGQCGWCDTPLDALSVQAAA